MKLRETDGSSIEIALCRLFALNAECQMNNLNPIVPSEVLTLELKHWRYKSQVEVGGVP